MNPNFVINIIKQKFDGIGSPAEIPKIKGGNFIAELKADGVSVDNLGKQPFLSWAVFTEAIRLLIRNGGWAEYGNAMNYKLGDNGLSYESIEGHIAHAVFGKKRGDSVFRRVTPIACILIWSGLCRKEPNGLVLTDLAHEDERIIRLHWNYFLALEKDIEEISRYIEFEEKNFKTYSVQLAHILMAISSEVDVVAKALCKEIDYKLNPTNIGDYRKTIATKFSQMSEEPVNIPRYNLSFKPWESWAGDKNPDWWIAYNNVKHNRSAYFDSANLVNVLNAISGLFVMIVYLRKAQIQNRLQPSGNEEPLAYLRPHPTLFELRPDYYFFIKV